MNEGFDPGGIANGASHPGEIVNDTSHRAGRAGNQGFWMMAISSGGQAGVGIESILVYAYILIYYFKKQGFFSEGFEKSIQKLKIKKQNCGIPRG